MRLTAALVSLALLAPAGLIASAEVREEIAHVLPHHAFTFETDPELRGLRVEAPDFPLPFAALLLHAAQTGRTHASTA